MEILTDQEETISLKKSETSYEILVENEVLVSDGSNTIFSNIDRTRTSNELERVHLLVIELEHPIFGFERSNIEHCSTHHYQFYC